MATPASHHHEAAIVRSQGCGAIAIRPAGKTGESTLSTFETLARELATRFDLGNQATPFLRMLMAHMTNPDKGG